jgi:hypothetical protein
MNHLFITGLIGCVLIILSLGLGLYCGRLESKKKIELLKHDLDYYRKQSFAYYYTMNKYGIRIHTLLAGRGN